MRMFLFVLLCASVIFADFDVESSGCCPEGYELETQLPVESSIEGEDSAEVEPINWNYVDINRKKEVDATSGTLTGNGAVEKIRCPDGWIRFQESCYLISSDRLAVDRAEHRCRTIGATLFTANSRLEWDTVTNAAPMNYHTWVGLFKPATDKEAAWHTIDGMNYKNINWLSSPFSAESNGFCSVSRCVAHWKPFTEAGKYAFFYPCNFDFYYICERNSTFHISKQ